MEPKEGYYKCSKCNGEGKLSDKVYCEKCLGTGIVDWVEQVTGKRIPIYHNLTNWSFTTTIDPIEVASFGDNYKRFVSSRTEISVEFDTDLSGILCNVGDIIKLEYPPGSNLKNFIITSIETSSFDQKCKIKAIKSNI